MILLGCTNSCFIVLKRERQKCSSTVPDRSTRFVSEARTISSGSQNILAGTYFLAARADHAGSSRYARCFTASSGAIAAAQTLVQHDLEHSACVALSSGSRRFRISRRSSSYRKSGTRSDGEPREPANAPAREQDTKENKGDHLPSEHHNKCRSSSVSASTSAGRKTANAAAAATPQSRIASHRQLRSCLGGAKERCSPKKAREPAPAAAGDQIGDRFPFLSHTARFRWKLYRHIELLRCVRLKNRDALCIQRYQNC